MKYLVTRYNLIQNNDVITEDSDKVFNYYHEAVDYAGYLCDKIDDEIFIFEIHLTDHYGKKPRF